MVLECLGVCLHDFGLVNADPIHFLLILWVPFCLHCRVGSKRGTCREI